MIVCGYSINLYCDNGGVSGGNGCPRDETHLLTQGVGEFDGQDRADAFRRARAAAWIADRKKDRCLCPQCRPKRPATPAEGRPRAGASDGGRDGDR